MAYMPITNIAMLLPNGQVVNIMPNTERKYVTVNGLKIGPIILEGDERFAIRDMLNLLYPVE